MPETLISTTEKSPKKQTKVVKADRPAGPWITARKVTQYLALAIITIILTLVFGRGWLVPQKGVPF